MTGLFSRVPRSWVVLACIALISLCMRGPIVSVAPVLDTMQAELGFPPVVLGLLTSIPVLCFSLASPAAAVAGRKFGAEFAVTLTLLGVLAGVVLRSAGAPAVVLLGTVLIGLAITVGNICIPLIIRRDVSPKRQGTAMGLYSAFLNVGAFLTSVVTAPIAEVVGWRPALAAVGIFALVATAAWAMAFGPRRAFVPVPLPPMRAAGAVPVIGVFWITAGLTVGFAGQAFSYYGVTTWLPSFLGDTLGMTATQAGAGASIFQVLAIVGSLGVPLLAKYWSPTAVALTVSALWATIPVGLLLAPSWWWLWCIGAGIAQGGGFTIIFSALIKVAPDMATAGRMSALVQGVGYFFAAIAPSAVGFVHEQAGNWTPPLLVILGSVLAFAICTTLSVRSAGKRRPS
ncbi:MFS transporter [Arthrobacter cupressi]|uniref:MFS transporter, CP family, cyanate transporter n=1 Tax=Arthrobacter cupressi TaxID=1045773 RepID=A0A1G8VAW9_9MICC|nr:MFS transporter [Arthrobacter cupressi]NYD78631.1 CP family cyanate transporter-like MFS transporter [Arthrobacter cupressi]SDJ63143.1 MFS transporter, CP family, cyanate transporter [Arthrobacter cupressi]